MSEAELSDAVVISNVWVVPRVGTIESDIVTSYGCDDLLNGLIR